MSEVKRYNFYAKFTSVGSNITEAGMRSDCNGEFVRYSDYKHLSDYCDHLVNFSKLPCLPKDLELLREANAKFATENYNLRKELDELRDSIQQILDRKVS